MSRDEVYYVLFAVNTDAMMLEKLLREEKIPARISPTPHDLQGRAGCGIALLVEASAIDACRNCIRKNQAPYFDIIGRPRQINPRRDRFC